jgi:hypothetical protein
MVETSPNAGCENQRLYSLLHKGGATRLMTLVASTTVPMVAVMPYEMRGAKSQEAGARPATWAN